MMESIYLSWPQYIFLTLIVLGMIVDVCRANGWRPPVDNNSDAFYAFRVLFKPIIWIAFLYWGGFFTA